jgi:NitT/TauT family transport system substrate-binding protein
MSSVAARMVFSACPSDCGEDDMLLTRRQTLHWGRFALAAGIGGLGRPARSQTSDLRVNFALNRAPFDASNAPFLLAERNGYFRDEHIDINLSLSKDALDALHRVASNEFDLGLLDFPVLLKFALDHPGEAPLYVFTVFDRSPAAAVTWRSSGVRKPPDLAGKTLAATPTDGAFQLFPVFLRAAGVEPASVKLKLVELAEREQLMLDHEVDGAIGFDSTIFYKLQAKGASLDDVDITYYSDGGLDLYSNGIIVSRRMLAAHPDRIAGVVRACARGWQAALRQPQDAIAALLAANPRASAELELKRFDWIRTRQIATPAVLREGLGHIDKTRVEKIVSQILAQAGRTDTFDVSQVYSDRFMPAKIDVI